MNKKTKTRYQNQKNGYGLNHWIEYLYIFIIIIIFFRFFFFLTCANSFVSLFQWGWTCIGNGEECRALPQVFAELFVQKTSKHDSVDFFGVVILLEPGSCDAQSYRCGCCQRIPIYSNADATKTLYICTCMFRFIFTQEGGREKERAKWSTYNSSQAEFGRHIQTVPIARLECVWFFPDWTNRVNDIFGRKPVAFGDAALSRRATVERCALSKQHVSGSIVDRSINASAA